MKRKGIGILAAAGLMLTMTAAAGTDYHAKVTASNPVSTGTVVITLQEARSDGSYRDMPDGKLTLSGTCMPGQTLEKQVRAKSDGTRPVYVRLSVSEEDGMLLSSDMKQDESAAGTDANWICHRQDGRLWYYYRYPLNPGESTKEADVQIQLDKEMGNAMSGKELAVNFSTEAVQKTEAVKAIKSAWGMTAAFDGNGRMETITEGSL